MFRLLKRLQMAKRIVKIRKSNTKYSLTQGQLANIVLAARGKSGCEHAKEFVKKIDKKYKLKKK